MVVKTITVTEDAYEALKRIKGEEESFSKVIIRVTKGKTNLDKFFGVLSESEAKRVKRNIKRFRKKLDKDYGERKHALSGHLGGD